MLCKEYLLISVYSPDKAPVYFAIYSSMKKPTQYRKCGSGPFRIYVELKVRVAHYVTSNGFQTKYSLQ
jgi:hypothetical protein